MKKLFKLVIVLVVLLIIAAVAVFLSIDTVARRAIERNATTALGVDTSMQTFHVAIFTGNSSLGVLRVANAEGYADPKFLELKDGNAALTVGSVLGNPVDIATTDLDGLEVFLERRAGGGNFQVILDNLKKFQESRPAVKEEETKKFMIHTLTIRNIKVHIRSDKPALNETIEIPMLQLKEVGTDSDRGAMLAEVTDIIVQAVLRRVMERAAVLLPQLASDLASELADLESYRDMGVKIFDDAGKQLEGVRGAVDETLESGGKVLEEGSKTLEGIGNIFGGEKKENQE